MVSCPGVLKVPPDSMDLNVVRTLAVIVTLLALIRAAAAAPELVEIPEGSLKLKAYVYRPTGDGPHPAVIALHACGGLSGRSGPVAGRYRDWGERLSAAGFVVLFPDSFGSRGLASQCTVRERRARSSHERVADANAARRWLQGKDWVKHDRVALVGWSSGATSTLWAVRPRAAVHDGAPDFRSAVA